MLDEGPSSIAIRAEDKAGNSATQTLAVKVDTIAPETLDRWVVSMAGQAPRGSAAPLQNAPATLELWHALLFILVLLVIGESMLGNLYFRPRAEP